MQRSTYLHANAALQVNKCCQSAALVLRKVDACFLEIMLQGATHPQGFWCEPLHIIPVAHSLCCEAADCTAVLVKGVYQVAVQLLIDVEAVHISCISTSLTTCTLTACPAGA